MNRTQLFEDFKRLSRASQAPWKVARMAFGGDSDEAAEAAIELLMKIRQAAAEFQHAVRNKLYLPRPNTCGGTAKRIQHWPPHLVADLNGPPARRVNALRDIFTPEVWDALNCFGEDEKILARYILGEKN